MTSPAYQRWGIRTRWRSSAPGGWGQPHLSIEHVFRTRHEAREKAAAIRSHFQCATPVKVRVSVEEVRL